MAPQMLSLTRLLLLPVSKDEACKQRSGGIPPLALLAYLQPMGHQRRVKLQF